MTPTITITNKFLEIIADATVGSDAKKLPHSIDGKCPMCWTKIFSNHSADIIAIGTKLKNSITPLDNWNFFKTTNGIILDNQVTTPVPTIVSSTKLKEGMFHHHPKAAGYQRNQQD